MSNEDVLNKSVHAVLVKPTHLRKLAKEGRIPQEAVVEEDDKLPKEKPKSKTGLVSFERPFFNVSGAKDIQKKSMLRAKLRTVHESIPPNDPEPPCDDCIAVCCRAFIVNITKEEYDSGLYGEYAIKIDPETFRQLRSTSILPSVLNGPNIYSEETSYVLEGMMGDPCPFLGDDNNCTIYEDRPVVCRAYSCVDDDRVTEGMRKGEEPILSLVEKLMEKEDV